MTRSADGPATTTTTTTTTTKPVLRFHTPLTITPGEALMAIEGMAECTSNSGNRYDVPPDGQKWVCVDLNLVAGTTPVRMGSFGLGVIGTDGFTYDKHAYTMDSRAFTSGDTIPAGGSMRKMYVLEVPAGVTPRAASFAGKEIVP